jgi:hypothetical protein
LRLLQAAALEPITRPSCPDSSASKIVDRVNVLANKENERLSQQFKPDLAERKKLDSLLARIDEATKRVQGKLLASSCDKEQVSAN